MKRSEVVVKGQDGEVKRQKIQVEDSQGQTQSASEFNPFLVEPILVKLLKLVDTVTQLKELRLMCQPWDQYNLKELEDRGFNGKLKAIDFCWTQKFSTKSGAEGNLAQFMRDTQAIPRLFHSFKFTFPDSWNIFSNHMEFFSNYPVTFLDLTIPSCNYLFHLEDIKRLFGKFMESKLWGNLKEITFSSIHEFKEKYGVPTSSAFLPPSENMVRKLQKLDIKTYSSSVPKIFELMLSGQYSNLTSMGIGQLEGGNLEFPGLDLSKLTRMEIGEIERGTPHALKFTSDLIKLAGNGMTLKNFGMGVSLKPKLVLGQEIDEFFFEHLRLICSNLTQFFSSQSSTLESLSFGFVCYWNDPVDEGVWFRIHLPSFEVLHTLKLRVDNKLIGAYPRTHTQLFEMSQNMSIHFPKLVNLILDGESSLIALRSISVRGEFDQLQLKRLEILDNYNTNAWNPSNMDVIGSVKELSCPAKLLGEILPWGESLCSLYIYICTKYGGIENLKTLKLNHFKKLKKLYANYYRRNKIKVPIGSQRERFIHVVENYKNNFKEATELDLTSFTFIGPNDKKIILREDFKEEFTEYFPFPVEFKISIMAI